PQHLPERHRPAAGGRGRPGVQPSEERPVLYRRLHHSRPDGGVPPAGVGLALWVVERLDVADRAVTCQLEGGAVVSLHPEYRIRAGVAEVEIVGFEAAVDEV